MLRLTSEFAITQYFVKNVLWCFASPYVILSAAKNLLFTTTCPLRPVEERTKLLLDYMAETYKEIPT
jgi:hypothetical protein